MLTSIPKIPTGNMDLDSSEETIKTGDYSYAKNLTFNQVGNQGAGNRVYPIKGHDLTDGNYYLGKVNVILGYKVIRIYVKKSQVGGVSLDGNKCKITAYTSQGNFMGDCTLTTTNPNNTVADYAAYIITNTIDSSAGTVLAPPVIGSDYVLTPNDPVYAGYIRVIALNVVARDNWYLTCQPVSPQNFVFDIKTETEALPESLQGLSYIPIASESFKEHQFVFATPISNKTFSPYDILGETGYVHNTVDETFNIGTHDFVDGDEAIISGFTSTTGGEQYNGIWSLTVVDTTHITLNGSRYIPPTPIITTLTPAPTATKYIAGYGAIFYCKKNPDGTWITPIRLIAARQLDFVTWLTMNNAIEVIINNFETLLGFTDYYTSPKFMIYRGVYMTDGFLDTVNPLGLYSYDTLAQEAYFFGSQGNLKLTVQEQARGGALPCANYDYIVQGVGSDGTLSMWSIPTKPISVIDRNSITELYEDIKGFEGSANNTISTKSNLVTVTGIPQGIYSYLNIAFIKYDNGGGVTGATFKKLSIANTDTTVSILHTGQEPSGDIQLLSLETLNQIFASIDLAQNISKLQNRFEFSKCTLNVDKDLTDIALQVKYTVKRKAITASYIVNNLGHFGDYQIPEVINKYPSLMLFETTRLGMEVHWKKGQFWSKSYYVDDIIIDASGASGRRLGGLPDYKLSTNDYPVTSAYSFYIEATNVLWDALVDGVPLRSLIDDIRFVTAPQCKEVLVSGIGHIGRLDNVLYRPYFNVNTTVAVTNNDKKHPFFYSPQLNRINANGISFLLNDKIISLGDLSGFNNIYSEATVGVIDVVSGGAPSTVEIIDVTNFCPWRQDSNFSNLNWNGDVADAGTVQDFYALTLSAPLTTSGNNFSPVTLFYFRPIAEKYPLNVADTTYIPKGNVAVNPVTDDATTTYDIFCGEVFNNNKFLNILLDDGADTTDGSISYGFRSMSRENTWLQQGEFPGLFWRTGYDFNTLAHWYVSFAVSNGNGGEITYSEYADCFNIREEVFSFAAFDPLNPDQANSLATVYYSLPNPEDSRFNSAYRTFLVNNKKSMELKYGAIEQMFVDNGLLFTVQPKQTLRQYFDPTGNLVTSNADVILGTGDVMQKYAISLSSYGTTKKNARVQGKSQGGKDLKYIIDPITKIIMRHSIDDGGVNISGRDKIKQFLYNGLALVAGMPDMPDVIHGVWDEKNTSALFTVRAWKQDVDSWATATPYIVGDVVSNDVFAGFDSDVPTFFECILSHTSDGATQPSDFSELSEHYWAIVPYTNLTYYNLYTLIYNEITNGFKIFFTPTPKLWMQYEDTILAPIPVTGFENKVYEFTETGTILQWFCYLPEITHTLTILTTAGSSTITARGYNVIPPYPVLPLDFNGKFTDSVKAGDTIIYILMPDGNYYEIISRVLGVSISTLTLSLPYPATTTTSQRWQFRYCQEEEAEIDMIVNETNNRMVRAGAVIADTEIAPERQEFNTLRYNSTLQSADYANRDYLFKQSIPADITNPRILLTGTWIKVKTYFKTKTAQWLNKLDISVRELSPKKKT